MSACDVSHTVDGMPTERTTPHADAVVLGDSSRVGHTLKPLVVKLRDPLGIARGMAESIGDLVDDLRRLSDGSSAPDEVAAVLDELARTADLITSNITRALIVVEQDTLPASERWHTRR
jgi:hypothetical protein